MTGLYAQELLHIPGAIVPWRSRSMSPVPASGGSGDLVPRIGLHRGMYGAYARNLVTQNNYNNNDVVQITPDLMQPGGAPGGGVAMRGNPGRLSWRVLQDIYTVNRTSAARVDLANSATHALEFRALLASDVGLYDTDTLGMPIAGQSQEVVGSAAGTVTELPNPTGLAPFMWTLFGRCITADLGCQPGEVMAFGSKKQDAGIRGLTVSYSPTTQRFSVSNYGNTNPLLINKSGGNAAVDLTKWKLFVRFIALSPALLPMLQPIARDGPLGLWISPPQPLVTGLTTLSFAVPFTPVLVNSFLLCKTAEGGYSIGDWILAEEGDFAFGSGGGFSATFDGRQVTLAANATQDNHSLLDGSSITLTTSQWSWFFAFIG